MDLIAELLAVGTARYLLAPDWVGGDPSERLRDAALFAGGFAGGHRGPRALRAAGMPGPAAAGLVGLAAAATSARTSSRTLRSLADGAAWGAGTCALCMTIDPNFLVGIIPRLYVSHRFGVDDRYRWLIDGLSEIGLTLYDHSVPVDQQFRTRTRSGLRERLLGKIRGTSAVIVLVTRGAWRRAAIRDEVAGAIELGKPLVLVNEDSIEYNALPSYVRDYGLARVAQPDVRSILTSLIDAVGVRFD